MPANTIIQKSTYVIQAETPVAACYICCLASVPGKFLPQKAKDLGVPAGPLFGKLKAGIAVMGKDRMVQPDEVCALAVTGGFPCSVYAIVLNGTPTNACPKKDLSCSTQMSCRVLQSWWQHTIASRARIILFDMIACRSWKLPPQLL